MSAYRDDLEASVRRANALEAELARVTHERREDKAEFRVKVTELASDLEAGQARLRDLESRLESLESGGTPADDVDELAAQISAERTRLAELDTDVRALKTQSGLRRKKAGLRGLVIAAVVLIAITAGGLLALHLQSRSFEQRWSQAREQSREGTFNDLMAAARIYETLISDDESNHELLAEAAFLYATLALELGTRDGERAAELIESAQGAGVRSPWLAAAQTALALHRGEDSEADRILIEARGATDEATEELIYLRGLWYFRQESYRESIHRFTAAAINTSEDASEGGHLWASRARIEARWMNDDPQGALMELGRLSEARPEVVALMLLEARIRLEEGLDPDGGHELARSVLGKMRPSASPGQLGWAYLLEARFAITQGDLGEAGGKLRQALEAAPIGDPSFHAGASTLAAWLDEDELALEQARRAAELLPPTNQSRIILIRALIESGDLQAADVEIERLRENSEASFLRGRLALVRGDLEAAASHFEASRGQGTEAALALGDVRRRQGRLDEARQLYEDLIRAGVTPAPRVALGQVLLEMGDLQAASQAFDGVLESAPNHVGALAGKARVAVARFELDEARELLDRASSGEVASGALDLARGQLALRRCRPEKAIPPLQRAVEALDGDPLARSCLGDASLLKGAEGRRAALDVYKGAEGRRAALDVYSKVLESVPTSIPASIGMAELALFGSNIYRCKYLLEAATRHIDGRRLPATLEARLEVVKGRYAYEYQGDVTAGRDHFQRALALDEHLPEAHLLLGFVSEDEDNIQRACASYQRYLELCGEREHVDTTETRRRVRENCR